MKSPKMHGSIQPSFQTFPGKAVSHFHIRLSLCQPLPHPHQYLLIGSIGLMKAIDKFDLSFDVKFSTYAVPMISGMHQPQVLLNQCLPRFLISCL